LPTKDKKRKRQTIANKGQKEKKTNNSQQRTKREKDKQWSTKDKNRKMTIVCLFLFLSFVDYCWSLSLFVLC
jgi:hypothetical protein